MAAPVREAYFHAADLGDTARALRASIPGARRDRAFSLQQAALLVLDMQRLFCRPDGRVFLPSAAAIVPGLLELCAAFRERQRPLAFTRHLNTAADAGMMGRWWRELIDANDEQSELLESFASIPAPVFVKTQYDAFHGTALDEWLQAAGVRQLVVCGVVTHLCCESTVRSAFGRGYEVFFPIDGSATYNRDLHRASLLTLGHGFATLPVVGELLGHLE